MNVQLVQKFVGLMQTAKIQMDHTNVSVVLVTLEIHIQIAQVYII